MDVTTMRGEPRGPREPLLERWGERINPLVIKEVRQGGRSRVFWFFFGMMLLTCFVIALAAYSATLEDGGMKPKGQGFFFSFFVCLGTVHFFVIPYSAYRSLSRELEDDTWVLLVLTGLGPRRILSGKVTSFLVQAALYASAAGPFLLLSYYLNGIDLPIMLVVLGLGGAWLVFLTVVGVSAATLADGRIGRALVHFALLGGLASALLFGWVSAYGLSENGYRLLLREHAMRIFVAVFLWMMLSGGWLIFETAAARLALPTENYSRAPRRALIVQTACSALLALVYWVIAKPSSEADVLSVLGCLYLTGCGLVLATDADGQARPLRAATRAWSLLRPGAVRGFRLAVLLLLSWGLVCAGLQLYAMPIFGAPIWAQLLRVLAAPAYALLYLSMPLWFVRLLRSDVLASPSVVRLCFVFLVGLAGVLPPIIALGLGFDGTHGLINLLNPFIGLEGFLDDDYWKTDPSVAWMLWVLVAGAAGLSVFLADRALVARERQAQSG